MMEKLVIKPVYVIQHAARAHAQNLILYYYINEKNWTRHNCYKYTSKEQFFLNKIR